MIHEADIARLRLVHSSDRLEKRCDDKPQLSVLMRGVMFLALWLVALTVPLGFAILMLSLERM